MFKKLFNFFQFFIDSFKIAVENISEIIEENIIIAELLRYLGYFAVFMLLLFIAIYVIREWKS